MLRKDGSIIRILDRLQELLGVGSFDVVDKWDADLCAVGIARPDDHGVLVYISTFKVHGEGCWVSLELPPNAGSDDPFTPGGDRDVANVGELADIVRQHFGLPLKDS